jgi:hypothetical protein
MAVLTAIDFNLPLGAEVDVLLAQADPSAVGQVR